MQQIPFIDLFNLLYMFRATNSPIFRSTFWLYIQLLVQCTDIVADQCHRSEAISVQSKSAPEDGWVCRPEHVEQIKKINKRNLLHLVGCLHRWFIYVKWSRYTPGVAQRLGRGIALLFHDRGTRRGWVVSSTPRLHFTPGKDPVPILQEAGWATGPVWTGPKISSPPGFDHRPSSPVAQSLYRLSYRAHDLYM